MQMELATDLIRALRLLIDSQGDGRAGHPSDRSARLRAQKIAEKTALRRLVVTGLFTAALSAGVEAYDRELRYFSPLSLVREPDELPSDDLELDGSALMLIDR